MMSPRNPLQSDPFRSFDALGESLEGPIRDAMEVIFLVFAGHPFTLESVNKATCACGTITGAELRAALPPLLRQGWIVAAKNSWGERVFYIRQEALSSCAELWLNPRLRSVEPADVAGMSGSVCREGKPGLAWDLFRVLRWTAEHGLPLTSKGVIHQRVIRKLTGQLDLTAGDVAGLELTYPHQEVIPPQLALILDCMLGLDLVTIEQSRLTLNEVGLERWLDLSLAEMEQQLYKLLIRKYIPSAPVIQHFIYTLSSPALSDGNWYALSDLALHLEMCSHRRGLRLRGERESDSYLDWITGWLEALCAFGWMELAGGEGELAFFRWVSCPLRSSVPKGELSGAIMAEEEPFFIQSDYEVLVPPGVPFKVRWELENYSEPVILDRMSVYRIQSSRVKAIALACSRSIHDVLNFLETHSTGVPEPIRISLGQWVREAQRSRNSGDSDKEDIPKTSGSIQMNLPVYRVPSVIDDSSCPEQVDRQSFMIGNQSVEMIAPLHDVSIYEPVNEVPDAAQLFPGLDEVPVMWFKETRNYHDSTARKLFTQALEWRTKVELLMKGKPVEFLPVAVDGDKDWRIRGFYVTPSREDGAYVHREEQGISSEDRSETTIYPQDYEGMRLVLPETLYAK